MQKKLVEKPLAYWEIVTVFLIIVGILFIVTTVYLTRGIIAITSAFVAAFFDILTLALSSRHRKLRS